MLSICLSCDSERQMVMWKRLIFLLAVSCCGIAWSQERVAGPTIDLKKSIIKLDAPVDEACVGGRGRFLIARLRGRREIVVLDLTRRFVLFAVPLGEDRVLFAAGSTQLHIVAPESGLFQSWDLQSGARLREMAWPLPGYVKNISMGSGNDQRLAVCYAKSPHRSEPNHWATIEFPSMQVNHLTRSDDLPATKYHYHMRSSSGGELAVAWTIQKASLNHGVVFLRGSNAEWFKWPGLPNLIMPSETGSHLFTGEGVFKSTLAIDPETGAEDLVRCVPAVTGPMYLTRGINNEPNSWNLRTIGNRSPLATLRMAGDSSNSSDADAAKFGQRMIFSVEANCIATLTDSSEVVLYEFDATSMFASAPDSQK